jgi:hypothetical protein
MKLGAEPIAPRTETQIRNRSRNRDTEVTWASALKHPRASSPQHARAFDLKELPMSLRGHASRGEAPNAWKKWIAQARRCHLEPMQQVASNGRDRRVGIINAILL